MGTHPIFESDFDCLTESCLEPDYATLYAASPAHFIPSGLQWPKNSLKVAIRLVLSGRRLRALTLSQFTQRKTRRNLRTSCPESSHLPEVPIQPCTPIGPGQSVSTRVFRQSKLQMPFTSKIWQLANRASQSPLTWLRIVDMIPTMSAFMEMLAWLVLRLIPLRI